jgi:putative endonuclease
LTRDVKFDREGAGLNGIAAGGVKADDNAILNFARIGAGPRVEADVERIGFGWYASFGRAQSISLCLTPFVVIPTERSDEEPLFWYRKPSTPQEHRDKRKEGRKPQAEAPMPVRTYYVYILSSASGVLYTGVTGNLRRRVDEHKQKAPPGFASTYNVHRLVYFETFAGAFAAINRETQIKKYRREKKIALIQAMNPRWTDLSAGWFA